MYLLQGYPCKSRLTKLHGFDAGEPDLHHQGHILSKLVAGPRLAKNMALLRTRCGEALRNILQLACLTRI